VHSDPRLDAAVAALRDGRERVTEPRRAVLQALADLPDHPTAEQVVTAVEARSPGVHRATVYRTLDTLTALGIVTHVHVGHGGTAYHLADRRHLHAQCRDCGAVVDVPDDVLDQVRAVLHDVAGFDLDPSHVALSGRCADCRSSTAHHDLREEP
jgi:Fur family transcriptional regulator, ferric uptake regulator